MTGEVHDGRIYGIRINRTHSPKPLCRLANFTQRLVEMKKKKDKSN